MLPYQYLGHLLKKSALFPLPFSCYIIANNFHSNSTRGAVTTSKVQARVRLSCFQQFEMAHTIASSTHPRWLYEILCDNSTRRYKIEYGEKRLSNHMSHAVISLYRVGCSKDHIESYAKWYGKCLESYQESDKPDNTKLDPESLLGMNDIDHFNDLVDFYKSELKKVGDIKGLVMQKFPRLAPGMFTSALHGLIELGYGISVDSRRVVCQGLSYLHYSHVAIKFEDGAKDLMTLGKGKNEITDILDDVRKNTDFRKTVLQESIDLRHKFSRTIFQNRMRAFLECHTREAMDYVYSIKFPEFWDPHSLDMNQALKICDWIIDCAITTYVASETKNDFFLIHGVTSAWSFKQVISVLEEKHDILTAIQIFLCSFLADYVSVQCPKLNLDKVEEPKMSIEECLQMALKENLDEHVHKLIQVCSERRGENPSQSHMYTSACNIVLKYPMAFLSTVA